MKVGVFERSDHLGGGAVTEDGADWADVPDHMQHMPCISDEEILEIARVAKAAEKTLGGPQDMEWTVDKDLPFPESLF
jgi:pyruvate,water dikinase